VLTGKTGHGKRKTQKRDGKKEQRVSNSKRGEEKKIKPESEFLIPDGEDNEAKARSLVDYYTGNKGTLTWQFNKS
jgi:hypothetical protein